MKLTRFALASMLLLGVGTSAQAQSYQIGSRGSILGPTLNWISIYGAPGTMIPGVATPTGTPGLSLTVTDPSFAMVLQQSAPGAWHGNFNQGDGVLFAMGPVSFLFNSDIFQFGTQLQANTYGGFTGIIKAYDATDALLGTASINGTSNSAEDGSAVFLGIGSLTGMRRITLEAWSPSGNQLSLGLNDASIGLNGDVNEKWLDGPRETSTVPEPGTVALTAAGLLGLVGAVRRRQAKA